MPLPVEALRDGEDVLYDSRPSWTALTRPALVVAVVLAAAVAVVVAWSGAPSWAGSVILVVLLVAIARLGVRVLLWRSTTLAVTSARVVFRSGVLRRAGREIPIESVQDVSFTQGILERLAGAGSVTVESAGERGALPFVDVPHPEKVQEVVNRAAALARSRRGSGGGEPAGFAAPPSIPEQIAQLAELYRTGVLSEAEFQQKKSELLRRM
ncbi:MAG: PH domain-containing protein [Actinomycetota bacterium]|nr:PH domain-containing protein [Actinomycetota bacterium]